MKPSYRELILSALRQSREHEIEGDVHPVRDLLARKALLCKTKDNGIEFLCHLDDVLIRIVKTIHVTLLLSKPEGGIFYVTSYAVYS